MDASEAQKVVNILSTADGGCSTCVGRLVDKFRAAFPEFVVTDVGKKWFERAEWMDDEEAEQFATRYVLFNVAPTAPDTNKPGAGETE